MSQSGFADFGGLIGLTRTTDPTYTKYYHDLFTQGSTSASLFSIYMDDTGATSTMQIGYSDITYLRDQAAGLTYVPLSDWTRYWNVNIDGFRVGQENRDGLFEPKGYTLAYYSTACLDTGTTMMYIPKELYHPIIDLIVDGKFHYRQHGRVWSTCDLAKYESLYLLIDGTYFEVPPASYVKDYGIKHCMIALMKSSDHEWLLGDVFLSNFYSVWDNANNVVGLAPHVTSPAGTIMTTATLPAPTANWGVGRVWGRLIMMAVGLVFHTGVAAAVFYATAWTIFVLLD